MKSRGVCGVCGAETRSARTVRLLTAKRNLDTATAGIIRQARLLGAREWPRATDAREIRRLLERFDVAERAYWALRDDNAAHRKKLTARARQRRADQDAKWPERADAHRAALARKRAEREARGRGSG